MRTCPVCNVELQFVDYEGFRVRQCCLCRGHLVPLLRFKSIKRVDRKSPDELKSEAKSEFRKSSIETLKCPKCHLALEKRRVDLPFVELHTDVCEGCEVVWLDGGELALLQLGYQASSKFIDAQEFKRRMAELEASPARKARFEENLGKLPRGKTPWHGALDDAGDALLSSLLRSL